MIVAVISLNTAAMALSMATKTAMTAIKKTTATAARQIAPDAQHLSNARRAAQWLAATTKYTQHLKPVTMAILSRSFALMMTPQTMSRTLAALYAMPHAA